MIDETPLETAQRIWPGVWTYEDGYLRRTLSPMSPFHMVAELTAMPSPSTKWHGGLISDTGMWWWVGAVTLETAITLTRNHAQALARIVATSAGLEVRDGHAE